MALLLGICYFWKWYCNKTPYTLNNHHAAYSFSCIFSRAIHRHIPILALGECVIVLEYFENFLFIYITICHEINCLTFTLSLSLLQCELGYLVAWNRFSFLPFSFTNKNLHEQRRGRLQGNKSEEKRRIWCGQFMCTTILNAMSFMRLENLWFLFITNENRFPLKLFDWV